MHEAPRTVEVETDGGPPVSGYYWPGKPGDPDIFVFFHGRNMNAEYGARYAQYLLGDGASVLVASYRGFGENDGNPTEKGMMRDAGAFIAKARTLAGPDARIWLVGHSIGAAVVLHAAANDNGPDGAIKGVFAISAFTRVTAAAPRIVRALVPDPWDNVEALGQVHVPVIFFQGKKDKYIPASSGLELMAAARGPAVLLLGTETPHNPDMKVVGPWIRAAASALAGGTIDGLPPAPSGWTREALHP